MDSEEEDREGLTCAVCLDVYFSPHSCQPCSHVFCEPCLRTLARNRPTNTPCPLCRTLISHTNFHKGELSPTIQAQVILLNDKGLRSFIFKTQKSLTLPTLASLEERGVNSRFYGTIIDSSNKRLAWSEDLNSVISVEDWRKACLKAQTQSINSHLKLIQYKWLMRTYVTPYLLNTFDPNNPDVCVKCGVKGTFMHCLWECLQIQIFWTGVLNILIYHRCEDKNVS